MTEASCFAIRVSKGSIAGAGLSMYVVQTLVFFELGRAGVIHDELGDDPVHLILVAEHSSFVKRMQ